MTKNSLYTGLATVFFGVTIAAFDATRIAAAPGDLDLTFSGDGKLTDGVGRANGVVIQPDGKIVVVGGVNFSVARYNPDGSPDVTFGDDGKVTTPFGSNSAGALAVAVQPDGKIVVAGYACPCDDYGAAFFALARYIPDGSLDLSFDGDGKVTTTIGDRPTGYSVVIQPDNKIIVAGWSWLFGIGKDNFAMARYNSDGSLDVTFDGDGKVMTSICSNCNDEAFSVALQSDGKILAAGGGFDSTFEGTKFIIVRYNPDGSLDATFDSDGIVIAPIGIGAYATAVTTQADGKIVAAGASWNNLRNPLVRYNPNGSLDTTFDSDGMVRMPIGCGGEDSSIAIQSDGKIIAAATNYNGENMDFALARYDPDGSLDATFGGGDGITTADFDNSDDRADAMALDNNGRAVVAGLSDGKFAVARFLLASLPASFDFDGDGRSDISVFRPSDRVWYLDRSTEGFFATQFGLSTDDITPADYDGDGKTDIAVLRDDTWYWINSSDGSFAAYQFGVAGDVPVPADYTGDGRSELAVFRGGVWWKLDLANNQSSSIEFGSPGDKPVAADYDGDGRADQAFYRIGEWHLARSTQGFTIVYFGLANDRPVPGDYDGDAKTDPAVYRDGVWYLNRSQDGITAFNFGLPTDTPAPADYDGDGKTDVTVYREGTWYLQQSTGGFAAQQFGLAGDRPLPSAYLP